MPKLRRADDGHWYIRAPVHAARRVGTWQVSDEGVEYLGGMGYGEGGDIPTSLFNELCETNLVFTGGSGFGAQAEVDFLPAKGADKQLKLAVSQTEQGWILQVLIPELPAEMFAQLIRKANQSLLTKCSLRIDGERELLPVSHLWPGKGGVSWPLDPHEGSYRLALVGPWPSAASLEFLTQAIPGLDSGGTVFFASNKLGMRVLRGMTISPGDSYYLVLGTKQSQVLRIPSGVDSSPMGTNNGWKAWELRLPAQPDDLVKRWFSRFGVILEESKLDLDLVSPAPKRMLVTGLSMLDVGDEVVVAATASSAQAQLDQFGVVILCDGNREHEIPRLRRPGPGESIFFGFPVARPGTYQIRALKGRVVPLTFVVRTPSRSGVAEKLERMPPPLSVTIGERSYVAFSGDIVEERISVWIRRAEKGLTVRIDCPSSLRMEWTTHGMTDRRVMFSSEAGELLTRELASVVLERKAMAVEVDAGSFGRLWFRIAPEELRAAGESEEVSLMTLRRARWLSATMYALRREGEPELELSAECRLALGRLGRYAGCGGLSGIAMLPTRLVHHASALSRGMRLTKNLAEVESGGVERS
jgi:hypothetical protein